MCIVLAKPNLIVNNRIASECAEWYNCRMAPHNERGNQVGIYQGTGDNDGEDDGHGLGGRFDNMLVANENREGQKSFSQDHPDAGRPPCGHRPTYKHSVGTSGCWDCGWMYD